jgi:hypothetical protein
MTCCAVAIFKLLTPSLHVDATLDFVRWDRFYC